MKVVKNKKLKISKELLIQKAHKNKLFIVSNAVKELCGVRFLEFMICLNK